MSALGERLLAKEWREHQPLMVVTSIKLSNIHVLLSTLSNTSNIIKEEIYSSRKKKSISLD